MVAAGANRTSGLELSRALFPSCDAVVGMSHGCPDPEIMQQALVANETQRLYFTARPRVLTTEGAEQPYFFSVHVRSDLYAVPALERLFAQEGARTLAIVYEEYGNAFYTGLGAETVAAAAEIGFDVVYSAVLTRTAEDAAAGAFDAAALEAHLDAAHAARRRARARVPQARVRARAPP